MMIKASKNAVFKPIFSFQKTRLKTIAAPMRNAVLVDLVGILKA
jgi:hypothetical protein